MSFERRISYPANGSQPYIKSVYNHVKTREFSLKEQEESIKSCCHAIKAIEYEVNHRWQQFSWTISRWWRYIF